MSMILIATTLAGASTSAAAEKPAIFLAAGAVRRGRDWTMCPDDPQNAVATIQEYHDLDSDGRPEALVVEEGTFCYGFGGYGFALVGKQLDGSWRRIMQGNGIAEFLPTKGVGRWPDISIGGPGFCFPVHRWNGREYALHRHQYEGKPCRPER